MKLDNRLNAMTVDVEDYFQVSAFEGVIDRKDWDSISLRVGDNTHRLLDLFAENDVKATFFTLGWVAQRCPDVIKRLISEGHELASHGLAHQRATTMTREQLFSDVAESKAILEDIGGVKVIGYRAPSFSVNAYMACPNGLGLSTIGQRELLKYQFQRYVKITPIPV